MNENPFLKTVHSEVTNTVDTDTGEVIDTTIKTDKIVVDSKEAFFITYARVLGLYKDLSGVQIKVLSWLILNQTSFNSNRVTVTKVIKELISEQMCISFSAVNNSIKPLVDKGVLIRQGSARSATYLINPLYYWKGDLGERKKELKFLLEVTYKHE